MERLKHLIIFSASRFGWGSFIIDMWDHDGDISSKLRYWPGLQLGFDFFDLFFML